MDSRKQKVLITGASRGIGLELAREFARHGHELLLVARHGSTLDAIAAELRQRHGVEVHAIALDLGQPGAATALHTQVEASSWEIDVLANNAGIVSYGKFAETELAHERQLLQLNIATLTELAKLFLRPMLARGRGRLVNVASVGGYQPGGPQWAVYFASKAYVLSFSKALAVELRGSGVSITALCPGATATGFLDTAGLDNTLVYRFLCMDAASVARIGYRGIMKGKTVVIPGLVNKLLALAGELPPRRIALEVNGWLMRNRS